MIAHGRTPAEVAAELGADSLAYLSLAGVYEAIRGHARDALRRLLLRPVPARRDRRGAAQGRVRAAARARLTPPAAPPPVTPPRATPSRATPGGVRPAPRAPLLSGHDIRVRHDFVPNRPVLCRLRGGCAIPAGAAGSAGRVRRPVAAHALTDPELAPSLPGLGPEPPAPVARVGRPRGGAARALRLPRLPPRPARGGRGGAGGARRAGRDADRLGQVALLPAAGADADRPDARGLAAGVADAGPGRGARARRARARRAGQRPAGRARPTGAAVELAVSRPRAPALRRARAVQLARLPRAHPGARGSACSWSTRRTASRSGGTTSGPTTSAWPTRRAGSARRRSWPRRRRRRRRWRPTSWRASGCATRCGSPRGSTGRTSRSRSCRARPRRPAQRGIVAALEPAEARPAIVYAGTRAECDRLAARLAPRAVGAGGRLPRGHAARGARRGAAALHGRRGRGRGGHERVRHGRRQGRRADGLPRERARLARGLLPGGRPRGARRPARALPAVRLGARQGPARVLHRALDGRREGARARRAAAAARAQLRRRAAPRRYDRAHSASCASSPASCGRDEVVRAIVGHLARAGVVQPSPVAARPGDGPGHRRLGRAGARAVPLGRPGGHARALAPVPRGVGLGRGQRAAGARASCATSATRAAPAPAAHVLRRLRSRARAPAARARRGKAPRRPAQLAQRPADAGSSGRSTRRSSTSWPRPQPPVGRTRAVEILRGGRSKVVVKYAYDGLAAYGTWAHLRADAVLARVDALLQAGTLALHRRRASRSWRSA